MRSSIVDLELSNDAQSFRIEACDAQTDAELGFARLESATGL